MTGDVIIKVRPKSLEIQALFCTTQTMERNLVQGENDPIRVHMSHCQLVINCQRNGLLQALEGVLW